MLRGKFPVKFLLNFWVEFRLNTWVYNQIHFVRYLKLFTFAWKHFNCLIGILLYFNDFYIHWPHKLLGRFTLLVVVWSLLILIELRLLNFCYEYANMKRCHTTFKIRFKRGFRCVWPKVLNVWRIHFIINKF